MSKGKVITVVAGILLGLSAIDPANFAIISDDNTIKGDKLVERISRYIVDGRINLRHLTERFTIIYNGRPYYAEEYLIGSDKLAEFYSVTAQFHDPKEGIATKIYALYPYMYVLNDKRWYDPKMDGLNGNEIEDERKEHHNNLKADIHDL